MLHDGGRRTRRGWDRQKAGLRKKKMVHEDVIVDRQALPLLDAGVSVTVTSPAASSPITPKLCPPNASYLSHCSPHLFSPKNWFLAFSYVF